MAAEARAIAETFELQAKLDQWEHEFVRAERRLPPSAFIDVDSSSHLAVANAIREYGPYVSMNKIERERRVPPRPPGPPHRGKGCRPGARQLGAPHLRGPRGRTFTKNGKGGRQGARQFAAPNRLGPRG